MFTKGKGTNVRLAVRRQKALVYVVQSLKRRNASVDPAHSEVNDYNNDALHGRTAYSMMIFSAD